MAAPERLKLFRHLFNEEVTITRELCLKHALDFDFNWVAIQVLEGESYKLFREKMIPIQERFNTGNKLIWKQYQDSIAPFGEQYTNSITPIWEKFENNEIKEYDELDGHLKQFYELVDPAKKQYRDSSEPFLDEYQKSYDQLVKQYRTECALLFFECSEI